MNISDFWSYVNKDCSGGCWEWTGRLLASGYGALDLKIDGKWKGCRAHKISYQLTFGHYSPQLELCHKCDNKKCVNPDHLFLGTHADNMRDSSRKLRLRHGSAHPSSKLDDTSVRLIRFLLSLGNKCNHVAQWFDVTPPAIQDIRRGKTWKHVTT